MTETGRPPPLRPRGRLAVRGAGWLGRAGRWVLGVPLYFKITVANAVLAAGLVWFAFLHPPERPPVGEAWVPVALAMALVAAITVNAVLVHVALLPLRRVEATARAVEAGDLGARIAPGPLADRTMLRLARVVNRMLDALGRAGARQVELSRRLLAAEESERKRIAHELLDDPAQLLSSALIRMRLASKALERQEDAGSALEAARRDAVEALSGIQRIARGLRPPGVDELGAAAALEAHARRITEGTPVRLEVSRAAVDSRLSDEAGLALYRVLQEGLANALAHGDPRTLRLDFRLEGDEVVARLEDDGVGFDLEAAMDRPELSVGILRMLEKARHVGGRCVVESRPGGGTRLTLRLPQADAGSGAPGEETVLAGAGPLEDQPPRARRTAQ